MNWDTQLATPVLAKATVEGSFFGENCLAFLLGEIYASDLSVPLRHFSFFSCGGEIAK